MSDNGFTGGFIFVIRQIELFGSLSHYFGDLGIVHMAYMWKHMMLYLVIQSAGKIIHDLIFVEKLIVVSTDEWPRYLSWYHPFLVKASRLPP